LASPETLLEAIIVGAAPSWLPDADVLIQDDTEVPEDVLSAAHALRVAPSAALQCIRRAWGKVDTQLRREIGDIGEREVLRNLDIRDGVTVDHVASWSDVHGYDIAVADGSEFCHLEVKATTRENRLTIFLSRNEFETMRADAGWQLVVVVLGDERRLSRVYCVVRDWVRRNAPVDGASGGRWEAARLEVPVAACEPGIPALGPFITNERSPLLTGRA
jgi:hypothetical protein